MRIKSYFSGTVESAMELARRELGEEAVILNSRPAPADARHLGAYEVVFGVDDAPSALPAAVPARTLTGYPTAQPLVRGAAQPASAKPEERGHRFGILEGEIAALRHELRKMSRGLLAPVVEPTGFTTQAGESSIAKATLSRRDEQALVSYLGQRDLPERPARELVRQGRERLTRGVPGAGWRSRAEAAATGNDRAANSSRAGFSCGTGVFPAHPGLLAGMFADESELAAAVLERMAGLLRVDPSLGRSGQSTKVVALVGGAGAGKTTTLVKLAAHYGLRARRPAHIISTDNLRVGAAEQLRSYAAILGVGFDMAETAVALGQLLNEHANKDLILIDTPGLGPGQMQEGAALARLLGADPRVDCHLVVPAYLKGQDVARLLDRFHPYGASKVILTRLDETDAIGGLLLALDETETSISFLSMGQTIPEDLEPASVARLLDLFVGDPPMGVFLVPPDPFVEGPQQRMVTAGAR